MAIIDQLSSSVDVHTQGPNAKAAEMCVADPKLLGEIVENLTSKNVRLAGDCAEVMTKVAEAKPELVAPHAETLFAMLGHKNGRVRWEAAHAYGLVAGLRPEHAGANLQALTKILRDDKSVIVRDHAADAVANYGATGPQAAESAWPILREAAGLWEGKHAARILTALPRLVKQQPKIAAAVKELAEGFLEHERASVKKAAKSAMKAVGGK